MSNLYNYNIRILHISDFHFRAASAELSENRNQQIRREAWRRERVLGPEWAENLDVLVNSGRPFDLVCITGDVADWGIAQEYGPATQHIRAVLSRLGLGPDRLFVVPGNHDINRSIEFEKWRKLRDATAQVQHKKLSTWMAGGDPPLGLENDLRDAVLKRGTAYRTWVAKELGRPQLIPSPSQHGHLGYRQTIALPGRPFPIHIIGLDSAWLAGDEHDTGKLIVTEDQIGILATQSGTKLDGLRLALVHHPLTDLADGLDARRILADHVDILLRGHQHTPLTDQWRDPDRSLLELAAGCLYEGNEGHQYPNAFQIIDVTTEQNGRPLHYNIWFRGWSSRGHWHDDSSLYRDARDGKITLQIEKGTLAAKLVGMTGSGSSSGAIRSADRHLVRAIRNIAELGDTDVCPFPPEKQIFRLLEQDSLAVLREVHSDASSRLRMTPPQHETLMSQVGYTGFRWVTQLDPIWNSYFLGLCISIGEAVEQFRISTDDKTVFSYRFRYNDTTQHMFNSDIGWPDFVARSRELGGQHEYAIKCDIADFYHRVPHEKLMNVLEACKVDSDIIERFRGFLATCSPGPDIGIPVGGPGARLLSEVLLNQVDHVLQDKGIPFCRFADDYHLFAPTLDAAYSCLIYLSEVLHKSYGLTLQKLKTRVMKQREFLSSTGSVDVGGAGSEDEEIARFLKIKLRYDPYAINAEEKYDSLAAEMSSFDILGMLSREMAKSRVNEAVTRRLTKAVRFLDPNRRNNAVRRLISRENTATLAPVFATVLMLVRDIFDQLSESVVVHVLGELSYLYDQASPILRLDVNIAYWLRILGRVTDSHRLSARQQCVRLHDGRSSKLVRRDAILVIATLGGNSWLSTILAQYDEKSSWERRALIAVSHILAEGSTWRQLRSHRFDGVDRLYDAWGALVSQSSGIFSS